MKHYQCAEPSGFGLVMTSVVLEPIICTLICIKICENLFVGYVLKYILRLILELRVFLCVDIPRLKHTNQSFEMFHIVFKLILWVRD